MSDRVFLETITELRTALASTGAELDRQIMAKHKLRDELDDALAELAELRSRGDRLPPMLERHFSRRAAEIRGNHPECPDSCAEGT